MPESAAPSLRTLLQHRRYALHWTIWLVLNLCFVALVGFAQYREYRHLLQSEKTHLLTQVRVAGQVLTSQIRSADAALRTMLEGLDRWRDGNSGYLPFAQEHLKRVEHMMPGARTFVVLDANGVCQLSNRPALVGMSLGHRRYFSEARADQTSKSLHIAPPYESALGVWAITISRAIIGADGKFGGVVAATISPTYFESLMQDLRYAPDMRVTLLHGSGRAYVSSPPDPGILQTDFAARAGFFTRHLQGASLESFLEGTGFDGPDRMAMARTIDLRAIDSPQQFVAIASRSQRAIFGAWWGDVISHLAVWMLLTVLVSAALLRYQRREYGMVAKARDAELAVRRSNQRFEQVASTIPCVLFDFAVDSTGKGKLLYVGPYSQTLLGVAPEELVKKPGSFARQVHPQDLEHFERTVASAVEQGTSIDCEFRYLLPETQVRWLHMTATPGSLVDVPQGRHWSGYLFDISEDKRREMELHAMAYEDALTNAQNRRSFMEKLQAEFERVQRTKEPAALVMLDIDHFKAVNDVHGHDMGDEVLKHMVRVLQAQLRRIDTLGRLGGEEFAILLPATSLDAALHLAERLRQTVQDNPATLGDVALPYTVSMGVSPIDAQSASTDAVLKMADLAMYRAKHSGRNQVCSA